MADEITKEVIDNYQEHELHVNPDPRCSTCWSILNHDLCKEDTCNICKKFYEVNRG